jgi:small redox-active disulfide protein 2
VPVRKLQVLGPGCPACNKLADLAAQAVMELALDAEVEKVQDMDQILAFDVPATPALVVDGRVVICGRVPSLMELKSMIGS